MNESSQREAIAKHLKSGKSLTPLEALTKFRCLRLGARVWELKQQGAPIVKRMVEVGRGGSKKKVARYYQVSA